MLKAISAQRIWLDNRYELTMGDDLSCFDLANRRHVAFLLKKRSFDAPIQGRAAQGNTRAAALVAQKIKRNSRSAWRACVHDHATDEGRVVATWSNTMLSQRS